MPNNWKCQSSAEVHFNKKLIVKIKSESPWQNFRRNTLVCVLCLCIFLFCKHYLVLPHPLHMPQTHVRTVLPNEGQDYSDKVSVLHHPFHAMLPESCGCKGEHKLIWKGNLHQTTNLLLSRSRRWQTSLPLPCPTCWCSDDRVGRGSPGHLASRSVPPQERSLARPLALPVMASASYATGQMRAVSELFAWTKIIQNGLRKEECSIS